jgi:outer membrane protein assembly factor BamB
MRWLFTLLVAGIAGSAAAGDHWSQWRGPNANGTAPQADPPTTWDVPSGKNIRWKATLVGRGSTTPIIWGGQVFVVSAEPAEVPLDQVNSSTMWRARPPTACSVRTRRPRALS